MKPQQSRYFVLRVLGLLVLLLAVGLDPLEAQDGPPDIHLQQNMGTAPQPGAN
jgi:hypothetical protein